MTNVIKIKFSEDLPTKKQNELRHRMELARWKEEWRHCPGILSSARWLTWPRRSGKQPPRRLKQIGRPLLRLVRDRRGCEICGLMLLTEHRGSLR